jgi:hypothetical protein
MISPISNRPARAPERLPVERAWLYQPAEAWTYAHHPHLAWFNGLFIAMWSNGRRDEDAPGQRVLTAVSDDGLRWSAPAVLMAAPRGRHAEVTLTAAGFHVAGDTLVAYAGRYEYDREALDADGERLAGDRGHLHTGLEALTSRDGLTWSSPQPLGLPVVPNHGPQRTASGRLIISGNVSFPYSDDPGGLAGSTMTGIYPASPVVDDSASIWPIQQQAGWETVLCEGSWYQTDDGVLHMLLRSNTEWLWVTESRDDGATWSTPARTAFSDNATKFHFGRLPDGRFYYVGCPDPEPRWARTPLCLAVSDDGVHFDRTFILADDAYTARRAGLHKAGEYGYPHTLWHDGRLYVIVSRQKEAVEVLRCAVPA